MEPLLQTIRAARIAWLERQKLSVPELVGRTVNDPILTARILTGAQTDMPEQYVRALAIVRLPLVSGGLIVTYGGVPILTFRNSPDESTYARVNMEDAFVELDTLQPSGGYFCGLW